MPSIPLIALKSYSYGGRRLSPGQAFIAYSHNDAKVLKAIGAATGPPYSKYATKKIVLEPPREEPQPEPAPEPVEIPSEPAQEDEIPSEPESEPEPEQEPEAVPVRAKRQYKRRDMTAESE